MSILNFINIYSETSYMLTSYIPSYKKEDPKFSKLQYPKQRNSQRKWIDSSKRKDKNY